MNLSPCPFVSCGDLQPKLSSEGGLYFVACRRCGARGPVARPGKPVPFGEIVPLHVPAAALWAKRPGNPKYLPAVNAAIRVLDHERWRRRDREPLPERDPGNPEKIYRVWDLDIQNEMEVQWNDDGGLSVYGAEGWLDYELTEFDYWRPDARGPMWQQGGQDPPAPPDNGDFYNIDLKVP